MWPHRSVIPALGKLRLEDGKFKANLGCIVWSCWERETATETEREGGRERERERERISYYWQGFKLKRPLGIWHIIWREIKFTFTLDYHHLHWILGENRSIPLVCSSKMFLPQNF
jgi:hypothetical protein